MEILNIAIGWVMKLCYSISFNNYILTLFFFALIMQIILFPFGIKQQKSSVKLASIRPKEEAIRNKYRGRNDRPTQMKMQQEIQEMYKAENYSPTAGCLPLLIQLPIIFALFGVVRAPLTYTTDLDKTSVGENGYSIKDFYQQAYDVIDNQVAAYEDLKAQLEADTGADNKARIEEIDKKIKNLKNSKVNSNSQTGLMYTTDPYRQLRLLKFMQNGVDSFYADFVKDGKLTVSGGDVVQVLDKVPTLKEYSEGSFIEKLVAKQDMTSAYAGAKVYDFNAMLADKGLYNEKEGKLENAANNLPNFSFIAGTSLLDTPSISSFDWLLLIPLLVFLSSFWSAEATRKMTTQPKVAEGQPNPANSGFMRWGMPLMSTYFAITFPAAIGVYWIFRSIVSVGQQFILSKMYPAPVFTEAELKQAVAEEKKAKKRKKLITIEVDEDDTSYDELAISEERAEKIRRRHERQLREEQGGSTADEKKTEVGGIEKPTLKDDANRKE